MTRRQPTRRAPWPAVLGLPVLGLAWLASASCGESGKTPTPPSSQGSEVQAPSSKDEPVAAQRQGPSLADTPRWSLIDNRYLWHIFRPGLFIPFSSEGFHKYNHEYSRPWGGVVTHEGEVGRVLSGRQSTLRFSTLSAPKSSRMRLRLHGLGAGQRVSFYLNDKLAANLSPKAEWASEVVSLPEGLLREGENALRISVSKAQTVAGKKSYALWQSLEFLPDPAPNGPVENAQAEAGATQPFSLVAEQQLGGKSMASLQGAQRLAQYLEVPDEAFLRLQVGGAGSFRVQAVDAKGNYSQLWKGEGKAESWTPALIDLKALSGQLIRLELEAPKGGAWGQPELALAAAEVRERPAPPKNVILLVVDALRSDHVPLYSSIYEAGKAVAMPATMAEAQKGAVVFLNNQAASPSSPPSHGSIQTGMIPRVHGVDGDRGQIKSGTPTISTQVVAKGISAGYYGNNPFGMGRHKEPGKWTAFHQPGQEGKSNDCTTLVSMMLDFASAQSKAGKRFFISSLPYETHTPYRYHQGVSEHYYDGAWGPPVGQNVDGDLLGALSAGKVTLNESQWKQLKALYRGEAEYWDQCFSQLVKGLADAGLAEDTALVLTSDHGEGMYEHGRMGHAFGHYRELGDVPFVVFWPALGKGVRNISTVTSHRDIAPTILDILGIEPDGKVQGQSVLPMMLRQGPWLPRVVSLEYGRSYSLRARDYKLIVDYNGLQEIYDLASDPWESKDLSKSSAPAVRYLLDMAGFFLEYRGDWHYLTWGLLNRHSAGLLQATSASK